MEHNIECKKCGCKVFYKSLGANFIIFCLDCKEMMYLECEYGYGSVTPCSLYYKNKVVGTIDTNEKGRYILNSSYIPKGMCLKNSYLNALYEAADVVQKLI